MLRAAVFSNEQFVAWTSGKLDPDFREMSGERIRQVLKSNFCAVVVPGRVAAFEQPTIAVDPIRTKDFYAFVSTYISDYVPFSAFFRVVSPDYLVSLDIDAPLSLDENQPGKLHPLVGVAIAEAACYLQTKGGSGEDVGPAAVAATYSAVILQGLARGPIADITAIGRNWIGLRSAIGGDELPLPFSELHDIWAMLASVLGRRSDKPLRPEYRQLRDVMRHTSDANAFGSDEFRALSTLLPELRIPFSRLRGPREERTRAVQEALSQLQNGPILLPLVRDCIAGCLVSLLGDGSFQFFPLALSITKQFPTAPLWFAAWASFMPASDVLTVSRCLGRRIARDLLSERTLFSPPIDDIALDELRTIGSQVSEMPRSQLNALSVEIYPTISSRQRLPLVETTSENPRQQNHEKELKELRYLIMQSSAVLAKIEDKGKDERRYGSARGSPSTKRES